MKPNSKKPVFPRLYALCKELGIEKGEMINFLISRGFSKTLLRGNFILSTKMHKEVLSFYKPSKLELKSRMNREKRNRSAQKIDQIIPRDKTYKSITRNELKLPRLLAAAKEFEVGLDTLIEFLVKKGFVRDQLKPTAKLSIEMYKELAFEFRGEILEEEEPVIVEEPKITIGINANGKLVVKYYHSDGTVFENDSQLNLAGIYIAAFNKYSEIIKEFEELINSPNTKEFDLQKFLEKHPEFLKNLDYKEVIPQALITTDDSKDWNADFILVPFDQLQFCKILELKLPSADIRQREKSGHVTFSSKLYKSIQQLKDYARAFQSSKTREIFKNKYKVDVFSPDLQLVIGRSGDIKFKEKYMDIQREHGVSVSDWDTYLQAIKRKFT